MSARTILSTKEGLMQVAISSKINIETALRLQVYLKASSEKKSNVLDKAINVYLDQKNFYIANLDGSINTKGD